MYSGSIYLRMTAINFEQCFKQARDWSTLARIHMKERVHNAELASAKKKGRTLMKNTGRDYSRSSNSWLWCITYAPLEYINYTTKLGNYLK